MMLYSITPGSKVTVQDDKSYTTLRSTSYINFEPSDLIDYEGECIHFRVKSVDYFVNTKDVLKIL